METEHINTFDPDFMDIKTALQAVVRSAYILTILPKEDADKLADLSKKWLAEFEKYKHQVLADMHDEISTSGIVGVKITYKTTPFICFNEADEKPRCEKECDGCKQFRLTAPKNFDHVDFNIFDCTHVWCINECQKCGINKAKCYEKTKTRT